jgi:outer membrane immunogenic protein
VFFPGFVTVGGIPAAAPIVIVPSRFAVVGGVSGRDTDFLGGVQAGFNVQNGVFVFGVEGDISASRLRARTTQDVVDPFLIQTLTGTYTTDVDWIASLRLRAGRAFDRVLVYVTGGGAVAHGSVDSSFTLTNPIGGITFPIPFQGTMSANDKFTRFGWTVGGGFEWAFNNAWSIGAEYRHSDFGSKAVTLANTDPAAPADGLGIVPARLNMRLTLDQVTARVNYRFAAR